VPFDVGILIAIPLDVTSPTWHTVHVLSLCRLADNKHTQIHIGDVRMDWCNLLCAKRIREIEVGEGSHPGSGDTRSQFQRDYDRSLFSTPVRRLQDKAQVFPLEPHDAVRTRLTHSLEVSNVARGMAAAVAQWLFESGHIRREEEREAIQLIAATCGLIHDLGNPPFGHSGEESMRTWFNDRKGKLGVFFESCSRVDRAEFRRQLEQDFLNFEGNAQTIRIVSKLQVLADHYGLNLTAGTISASCKYTASSDQANRESEFHEKRKPGFFASENKLIEQIREITGTGDSRNPITYLVEASDDIVYSVVDIEDGIKKGVVGWEEVEGRLKQDTSGDDGMLGEILDRSKKYLQRAVFPLDGHDREEAMSQIFRTYSINQFVHAVVAEFKRKYDDIMSGNFHGELIKTSEAGPLVGACKKTANECIFKRDISILEREIAGRHVIYDLMDRFWESVEKFDPGKDSGNDFPAKIRSLISPNYRRVFKHSLELNRHPPEYCKMQLVTDYVCGMTDSFATRLHAKLTNG
jgi:dGTPase